jgi:predicted GNAT family acetyltransferase
MANDEDRVKLDERRITPIEGELEIVDVPERRRFEVRVGSRVVGHTRYARSGQAITLVHTEVDPDQEGKGIASRLAAAVLGDVIGQDLSVVVRCPFIAAYVRRHPAEYPMVELRD